MPSISDEEEATDSEIHWRCEDKTSSVHKTLQDLHPLYLHVE